MRIRKIAAGVLAFGFLCNAVTVSGIVQQRNSQIITKAADGLDYTESIYNELTYCAFDDHIVISDCDTSAVEVTIPEEIGSLPVTQIDDRAFCYCENLVSVTIPDTVTVIGSGAFQECTSLESVNIPSGVTELESSVFEDCSSLTQIIVPDGVESIGYSAFSGCSALQSVAIPENVNFIEDNAFCHCSSLESLAIPASTTYLGYDFCTDCSSLTDITVAEGNESYFSVDGALFRYFYFDDSHPEAMLLLVCPEGKTSYTIPDGTVLIGGYAFEGCASLESVQIPDSVREIRASAFSGCENLSEITIPEGIISIGEFAFWGCTSLQLLRIPASAEYLGVRFCENCPSLTTIDVAPDNKIYSSSDGVLFKNASYDYDWGKWEPLTLKVYPEGKQGSYSIPEGVGAINNFAFENCTGLESITIPESTVNIGWHAFRDCTGLKYATILNANCDISYYSWLRLREGGAIYGLENSTAQVYADSVRYEFRIAGAEEPLPSGDVNGDEMINAVDASMILIASANVGAGNDSGLTTVQEAAADVDADGVFNAFDASIILSYAAAAGAGYADSFPEFVEEFLTK
ncbi:MAG: leucine-rich repeat protein [Oscillospiraceae bacterium]|nr:leucine-rich repeat protein [Oscillospiraceae bacterium]